MSEVTFAKSYLATLDKRAIKLPADHAGDPRKYPDQSPATLPKQAHPYPQRTGLTSSQQANAKTIKATLKPMRTGEAVTIPNITLDTTIHDLKTQYAEQTGQAIDKLKLLLNKKPTADLKSLKELGVESDVELSVMVMGGAAGGSTPGATTPALEKIPAVNAPVVDPMDIDSAAAAPESEKAQMNVESSVVAGTTADVLKTEEFWTDLKGFLTQRLRDEGEGARLAGVFREASSRS